MYVIIIHDKKDCHLWRGKHERMVGNLPGQIYSYPSRRWRLETVTPLPQPIKKGIPFLIIILIVLLKFHSIV